MGGVDIDEFESKRGVKFDDGKMPWHLLPWGAVEDAVRVLDFGAKKYAPDNWRAVPGWRWRYFGAAMRHLLAWWRGEQVDAESGLPHLAHAMVCLIFLAEKDKETAGADNEAG